MHFITHRNQYGLPKGGFSAMRPRERTVQPKLDRSDPVLFSRARLEIQYRSSTDVLMGREG